MAVVNISLFPIKNGILRAHLGLVYQLILAISNVVPSLLSRHNHNFIRVVFSDDASIRTHLCRDAILDLVLQIIVPLL